MKTCISRLFLVGLLVVSLMSRLPADEPATKPKAASGKQEKVDKPVKPAASNSVAAKMLAKNNELRKSQSLPPHTLSSQLCKAAQLQAEYMASTGQFDHYVNGTPGGRATKAGYSGSVSENIAAGYSTVQAVFAGWRSSGGHWASIVSDTQHAGFGRAESKDGRVYWVAMYGNPSSEVAEARQAPQSASTTTYTRPRRRFRLFRRR